MNKRISTEDEKQLAERLRRDARGAKPDFSEGLHSRICQAVRQSEPPKSRRTQWFAWRRRRWLMAVAAALVISATLAAWWLSRPPLPIEGRDESKVAVDDTPTPVDDPPVPVVDPGLITGAEELWASVDTTLSAGQWAYLDHDARLAAEMLLDQLPFDVALIE
ncbi:MAG: hypothetical protein ACYTG0_09750 [Planctomycetota bacterium]|jgi:hypothetical protein